MKISNRAILCLILAVAVFLRVYHLFQIPFTHDEFSAFFRLRFATFAELIDQGVKVDGHPAGVQVFLYYWTKVFGFSEWVIKLPFLAFGVASVWLIYLIGKKWFNETVGLLAAAFLACLQYSVMYSQIARPYSSGLFFSLALVVALTNLVKEPGRRFYLHGALFVAAGVACAYNHHFSLLFAALVGISGLFLVPRQYMLRYAGLGLLVFLLYVPHLPIFFYQLEVGGVGGWLPKPRNDFFTEYLAYIFHFSVLLGAVVAGIVVFGLKDVGKNSLHCKAYMLFASLFLLPFLIGFFYSRYVNAVLQYSVLIFGFPFLFFLLFGHIRPQKSVVNLMLVAVILVVGTYTLAVGRQHYYLLYQSPYRAILTDYLAEKLKGSNTVFVLDSHERITRYYATREGIDTTFVKFSSFGNLAALQRFVQTAAARHDQFYLGVLSQNPALTGLLIRQHFPNLVWQNNYAGGTTYLFSKTKGTPPKVVSLLNFETTTPETWSSVEPSRIVATEQQTGQKHYLLDSTAEFSPTYTEKLAHLIKSENDFIDLSVRVKPLGRLNEAQLVTTLEQNGELLHWSATNFDTFIPADTLGRAWQATHHSVNLADVYQEYPDIVLKVYIWNKGKSNMLLDDFTVQVRPGNPMIYGLYEEIK